jgi:hypothetical protein
MISVFLQLDDFRELKIRRFHSTSQLWRERTKEKNHKHRRQKERFKEQINRQRERKTYFKVENLTKNQP